MATNYRQPLLDLCGSIVFGSRKLLTGAVSVSVEGGPADITGLWMTHTLEESGGGTFKRGEIRRVIALRRSDLPTVPRGTILQAPERDGRPIMRWLVDGHELMEADHHRVVVIPLGPLTE